MAEQIDRRDLDFQLYELIEVQSLCALTRYKDHDRETFGAVLDSAYALAQEKFLPYAAKLDASEPYVADGKVQMADGVIEALRDYSAAGFLSAGYDESLGGMQLPEVIVQACTAIFDAASIGLTAYPFLTRGAANLILSFGDEDQKKRFLMPMLQGRFFGTMCLSEAQAGSSLSDISTKAMPTDEGHYLIQGGKMWITGGEHELAENIIHLLLARMPGGGPGVKGISLFIVPRFRVDSAGRVGAHNHVSLVGLNHKMGCRGSVNTALNFGESGECLGYLLGKPHHGLNYMFQMMNEARIGVGLSAVALAYPAYLQSLEYARNRHQGRPPQEKDPQSPPVPIIEHADVKRMLLLQKSFVEGGLALLLYCARLVDELKGADDESSQRESRLLLEILTPVAKSWPSEFCLEANKLAIQVLGGYGYTRDFPAERLYRDNRLNAIHEGTQGIHGIDLLGRKVRMQDGAAFTLLLSHIGATIESALNLRDLYAEAMMLQDACARLRQTTETLVEEPDLRLALANATPFLDAFGHIVVAWMWLRQALVAQRQLESASLRDRYFYDGKIRTCRFFLANELPDAVMRLQLIAAKDRSCLDMPQACF